jgi:raffinose/stachyose/melibiose transport system substrate-binding protein
LFYSGEAAMNPTGTWLVSEIIQAVQEFEVGFFPFPSIEGSSISPPAGVGTGWFVANDAKNPQEAITFIDYLLQDDTARLTIEKLNTIPAHPVDTEGLDVPELFKQVLDDLSEAPQAEALGYNIDVLAPQNFNDPANRAARKLGVLKEFRAALRDPVEVYLWYVAEVSLPHQRPIPRQMPHRPLVA